MIGWGTLFTIEFINIGCSLSYRVERVVIIEAYPAVPPTAGSLVGYDKLLGMGSHAGSKTNHRLAAVSA